MRRTLYLVAAIATACAQASIAQQDDGSELIRKALEGRSMLVKMDLPAIDAGVYMFFDDAVVSFDEAAYKKLVKDFGVSLKKDTRVRITAVRISTKGIELDLDGGGAPARDWIVNGMRLTEPTILAKSDREVDLERQLQHETNPALASHLRNDLETERERRLSQDERNRQSFARVSAIRTEYIEANRKNWGSRLIVVVRSRKPSVPLRDMVRSLAKYVELLPREPAPK